MHERGDGGACAWMRKWEFLHIMEIPLRPLLLILSRAPRISLSLRSPKQSHSRSSGRTERGGRRPQSLIPIPLLTPTIRRTDDGAASGAAAALKQTRRVSGGAAEHSQTKLRGWSTLRKHNFILKIKDHTPKFCILF